MSVKKPANQGAFLLNTHELPRRAGEMKEYELDIPAPFRVGVPLIGVPENDLIELDVRCESVTEGILVTADIYAVAVGECIRCLDPVELSVDKRIQALYRYERGRAGHSRDPYLGCDSSALAGQSALR